MGAAGELVFRDCIGSRPADQVDVLFVIDDGPHAAGLQARLADAWPAFTAALDDIDPEPRLRIGFTTAHDGNPACMASPGSGGSLRLQSCREHPEGFVSKDGTDTFASRCAAHCELERFDVVPTSTWDQPDPVPRPWIDVGVGGTLPTGVALNDALTCASILGTNGCALSAPLASARRSMARSELAEDASNGFWRGDASRIVVLVSGGLDCSITSAGVAAFDAAGDRALWSDPGADAPTPAACWNAGISCSEPIREDDTPSECAPADIGVDGTAAAPEDAVLAPVADLVGAFHSLAGGARWISPSTHTTMFIIAGVPEGASVDDPIEVRAAPDGATALELGVAPICSIDGDPVVPSLRLAAFATAALGTEVDVRLASACADDYAPVLEAVAAAIAEAVQPICWPRCALDIDENAPGLQVDCSMSVEIPLADGTLDTLPIPTCGVAIDGTDAIPPDAPGCWSPRTDHALHPMCAENGFNLELRLQWDGAFPAGAQLKPMCELSSTPATDCPEG